MEQVAYDRYPPWVVVLSNVLSISIWIIGAYILSGFGLLWSALYLAYCIWLEFRLLRHTCVDCWYHGRQCAFGKGRLCGLLFEKGDPAVFADRQIGWKDLVPDLMVFLIPFVGGIVLVVQRFSVSLALLLGALLILSFRGNALIRGKLAYAHCRQREMGCPAALLFFGKAAREGPRP
ncbi:MAG: hypothetical protein HXY20_12445 [Acidobacteria bacterium]|nr:hypothetical protein [Acidobacteriota bacterium]